MSRLVNKIRARMFLGGDWRDVSSSLRYEQAINIRRGYGAEDEVAPPSTCKFTLDNRSGDFTERNPLGQWYGHLGRSTPFELACQYGVDTASVANASAWGTTEADANGAFPAYAWTDATSGASGGAGDFSKASGKLRHRLTGAASIRFSYLASFSQRDIDFALTVNVPTSNVTGGALAQGIGVANIMLRGQGALSDYYMLRLIAQTDETYTTDWWAATGGGAATTLTGGSIDVPGVTQASQDIRVRVQAEGRTLRSKIWNAADPEPYDWTDTWTVQSEQTASFRDSAGWIGVRSSLLTGNTNGPITISYDDLEFYGPEFSGEIPSWPKERDTTGSDRTIAVTAADVTRRLEAGEAALNSALRRELLDTRANSYTPWVYWPLEDGEFAVPGQLFPAIGTGSLGFEPATSGSTVGKVVWAAERTLPGGSQAPTVSGGGSLIATLGPSTETGAWSVGWCMKQSYADGSSVLVSTDQLNFQIHLLRDANSLTSNLLFSLDGAPHSTIASWTFEDKNDVEEWHYFEISCFTNPGLDTAIFLAVDEDPLPGYAVPGVTTTRGLRRIHLNTLPDTTQGTSFGHVFVMSSPTSGSGISVIGVMSPFSGHSGELALTRMWRLCQEEGIDFGFFGSGLFSETVMSTDPMGRQRPVRLIELLRECAKMDNGLLYSQRGVSGLQFRTLRSMYSRTPWVELSMASRHFSPPWGATADDRFLVNDILVRRPGGGDYRHKLDDGSRMSVSSPADGGAGEWSSSADVNVETDEQLPDQATWRVHQGTIDEDRFPGLRLELHRDVYRDTAGLVLSAKLRDLDIGDLINLADLQTEYLYDDLEQLVVGISKRIDQLTYDMTLACRPASRYRVLTLDDATYGLLDSGSSTLASGVNSSATSLSVATSDPGDLWTTSGADFPFDVKIGGERMTVTNITGATSPQTFTVTRNVNGLPGGKSHSAGASVNVANPNYIGL